MSNKDQIKKIFIELLEKDFISNNDFRKTITKNITGSRFISKSEILDFYNKNKKKYLIKNNLLEVLKTKPSRTLSGVTPLTVLTKPYPCPGKCIFCPNFKDQPKSYISSEPGAARAKMLGFDPFLQVLMRIQAFKNNGHNTDKIELLVLGGTFSFYPRKYQLWFILRCFMALNEQDNKNIYNNKLEIRKNQNKIKTEGVILYKEKIENLKKLLIKEQNKNEKASNRCIGLVLETRPDFITVQELKFFRLLGATKLQIGVQILDNKILKLNKRGHNVSEIKKAVNLARLFGFKLHLHFMPNLYGSNPKTDYINFVKLFTDISLKPDELKIYPTLLIRNTELFKFYREGKYKPYTYKELLDLLVKCKLKIPKYCRINRLFRDIPSSEIEAGIKLTNFRQIVLNELAHLGKKCNCIRCREIKNQKISIDQIKFSKLVYKTKYTTEYFLSYITKEDKITAFLRLSIINKEISKKHPLKELNNSSIIREIHVYGESIKISSEGEDRSSQHLGLGKKLILKAEEISRQNSFSKISVISAIGTRSYYSKLGYSLENLYQSKSLI